MRKTRKSLFYPIQDLAAVASVIGMLLVYWMGAAIAAENDQSKTAGGLVVYLGVMPAELIKGPGPHSTDKPMHGRSPRGPHEFHIVVAVFDAGTGERISDATVTAKVSGVGLSGTQRTLEAMKIADTITYGSFFSLPRDLYRINLTVRRPGAQPVPLEFKYDHRR